VSRLLGWFWLMLWFIITTFCFRVSSVTLFVLVGVSGVIRSIVRRVRLCLCW